MLNKLKEKLVDLMGVYVNVHTTRRDALVIDFKYDSFDVQIVINNYFGMLNTQLVRFYCEFDSRFHKMAIFIKWWVKQRQNELRFTKQFKLNSFSLTCMLIVYLQDIENPPLLPKIKTSGDNKLNFDLNLDGDQARETLDDTNHDDVADIYKRFINFYFNGEFNYLTNVVNTADGCIDTIENVEIKIDNDQICPSTIFKQTDKEKLKLELKESVFAIIDPFDHSYGPGRR